MAQDLSRHNGKIHRIHHDGKIPKDNPFVNTPKAVPSIWTYGNRNPQGLTISPSSGALWSAEHGPRGGDELNLLKKSGLIFSNWILKSCQSSSSEIKAKSFLFTVIK